MIDLQGLGDRLRAERERLGLSQGKFAEIGGVTRTTAFRYETDAHSPSLEFLQAIEATGVDSVFIIFGTDRQRRIEALADAMTLVEDLLAKHELSVTTQVRAALVARVLDARQKAVDPGHKELDMGSLLTLVACPDAI